jgi:hypothetical protein
MSELGEPVIPHDQRLCRPLAALLGLVLMSAAGTGPGFHGSMAGGRRDRARALLCGKIA